MLGKDNFFKSRKFVCDIEITNNVIIKVYKNGKNYDFYLEENDIKTKIGTNIDWESYHFDDNIFSLVCKNSYTFYPESFFAYDKINNKVIDLDLDFNLTDVDHVFFEERDYDLGVIIGLYANNPEIFCTSDELEDLIDFLNCGNEDYPLEEVKRQLLIQQPALKQILKRATEELSISGFRALQQEWKNEKVGLHCLSTALVDRLGKQEEKIRTK